jgi:DNA-binding HxlR family transcriptional regulator
MTRREYGQSCSLACALDRVGERWSLLIVRELSLGPMRFAELARAVGGAPTDVLTKRLRDMEREGVVRRCDLEWPASAVGYELTELGRALEHPMLELSRWGLNFETVASAAALTPGCLPSALRTMLVPPPDAACTVGLRIDERSFGLRIEDGWIEARRGDPGTTDLTLTGSPVGVMAAVVIGSTAEAGVEIDGDRRVLDDLRAMVVLPEKLRAEARAAARAATACPPDLAQASEKPSRM